MSQGYGGKAQVKFVNLEMQPRDREPFKAWKAEKAKEFWSMIERMTDSGYRFSFGHDDKFNCKVCNVTCTDTKSPNYPGIMPSRADEIEETLWIALYKHHVICQGEWPLGGEEGQRWG